MDEGTELYQSQSGADYSSGSIQSTSERQSSQKTVDRTGHNSYGGVSESPGSQASPVVKAERLYYESNWVSDLHYKAAFGLMCGIVAFTIYYFFFVFPTYNKQIYYDVPEGEFGKILTLPCRSPATDKVMFWILFLLSAILMIMWKLHFRIFGNTWTQYCFGHQKFPHPPQPGQAISSFAALLSSTIVLVICLILFYDH